MNKVLLAYKGTIGSIIAHYIEHFYDVKVYEYGLEPGAFFADNPRTDVVCAFIVSQSFPADVFEALSKHVSGVPIIWLCQDKNNTNMPHSSVTRYLCDGVDEWKLFNKVLEQHLGDYHK